MQKTSIKMRPVCDNCGYVFKKLTMRMVQKPYPDLGINYIFEPGCCPNCKSEIEIVRAKDLVYRDGIMVYT